MAAVPYAPTDHLALVLRRVHRLMGVGAPADDLAVRITTRFLAGDEPEWLRRCTEQVRLDVLTVHGVLAARRG